MRRLRYIAAIVAVAAILVKACGGDARDESGAPAADAPAADATADTDTTPANESAAPTVPADVQAHIDAHADLIRIETPSPIETITSPLTVTGEARGSWYFEASFPVVLVDWDGKIIADTFATAEGEWMTEDFVPFRATLEFEVPAYGERGSLILRKDNPSDRPELDDALEVPIRFERPESGGAVPAP